jgi:CTP:molybdopterin cytidylyltransferase MocA
VRARIAFGDAPGQVVVGVDRNQPVDVDRRAHVYVEDARMGMGAADERGRQRIRTEVVEVATVAADQPVVLDTRNRLAEQLRAHERVISAARRTDFTMFW